MLDIKVLFTKILVLLKTLNTNVTVNSGTLNSIQTVTLGNNTTLNKVGSVVYFNIDATTSANIASGSAGSGFITFPSGYRPSANKSFVGRINTGTVGEYHLTSGGSLQTLTSITSGATFRLSGSFVI